MFELFLQTLILTCICMGFKALIAYYEHKDAVQVTDTVIKGPYPTISREQRN
jgi:hypothetical protein